MQDHSYAQLNPAQWEQSVTVKEWWMHMGALAGVPKKGLHSLLLLVSWQLWLERNARTFQRKERPAHVLMLQIKEEARAWEMASAKHLAGLLGEI